MEDRDELRKLLEKQNRYAKWQCILTAAAAVCCIGVFLLACAAAPKVQQVLDHLDTVTRTLAEADLAGMIRDVDKLAETSQTAVEQAGEKLNTIDLETLNRAIGDLADVVEPLARFFQVFD